MVGSAWAASPAHRGMACSCRNALDFCPGTVIDLEAGTRRGRTSLVDWVASLPEGLGCAEGWRTGLRNHRGHTSRQHHALDRLSGSTPPRLCWSSATCHRPCCAPQRGISGSDHPGLCCLSRPLQVPLPGRSPDHPGSSHAALTQTVPVRLLGPSLRLDSCGRRQGQVSGQRT